MEMEMEHEICDGWQKITRDKIYNPWCVEEKIMQNVQNGTLDIARERKKKN
jgi:hypothetical protein